MDRRKLEKDLSLTGRFLIRGEDCLNKEKVENALTFLVEAEKTLQGAIKIVKEEMEKKKKTTEIDPAYQIRKEYR